MTDLTVYLPYDALIYTRYSHGKDKGELKDFITKYIKDDDVNLMYLKDVLRETTERLGASEDVFFMAEDVLKDMPPEEMMEYITIDDNIHTSTMKDREDAPEWVGNGVILELTCKFDDEGFLRDMEKYLESEVEK